MKCFCTHRNLLILCFVTLCLLSLVLAQDLVQEVGTLSTTATTTASTAKAPGAKIESPTSNTSDATSAATVRKAAETTPSTTTTSTTTGAYKPLAGTPSDGQIKRYSISSDIPTCQLNDSQLNDCIKGAFEIMLPRLRVGDKDLNIPPLDPFKLNRTVFEYMNGRVSARLTMKRAQVFGFGKIKINDVDFKIDGNNDPAFLMSASVPLLRVVGDYKADVAINTIKLRPRGSFNISITKVAFNQSTEGSFYEKDAHRFVRLRKFDVQPTIGGFKLDATGLFPDPTLNEIILNSANQYWREIFRIVLPEVNRYLAPLLLRIINESLATLPFDLIVKDHQPINEAPSE